MGLSPGFIPHNRTQRGPLLVRHATGKHRRLYICQEMSEFRHAWRGRRVQTFGLKTSETSSFWHEASSHYGLSLHSGGLLCR